MTHIWIDKKINLCFWKICKSSLLTAQISCDQSCRFIGSTTFWLVGFSFLWRYYSVLFPICMSSWLHMYNLKAQAYFYSIYLSSCNITPLNTRFGIRTRWQPSPLGRKYQLLLVHVEYIMLDDRSGLRLN